MTTRAPGAGDSSGSGPHELILVDALLPDGRRTDIGIRSGRISAVGDLDTTPHTGGIHDLAGALVIPSLVEPHAHLDKALTADVVPNPTLDLAGAVQAWRQATKAGRFDRDDVTRRALEALRLLTAAGVTAVRSHVNSLPHTVDTAVAALVEVRRTVSDLIDLQLVALTGPTATGPAGAEGRAGLARAIELGVDVVGGAPQLDPDPQGAVDVALAIAGDARLPVDLHMDETLDPEARSLHYLARRVIETGFPHRVTASHCVSLGVQTPQQQIETARLVAEAGIGVITLPQTNLYLQARGVRRAPPRGLTALDALEQAGVQVCAGGDNVEDPYNPLGRSDPLEAAALMVLAAHRSPDQALQMVSTSARAVLGLEDVSLAVGSPADLVAIRSVSPREAMARAPQARTVYRRGHRIAHTETRTTFSPDPSGR